MSFILLSCTKSRALFCCLHLVTTSFSKSFQNLKLPLYSNPQSIELISNFLKKPGYWLPMKSVYFTFPPIKSLNLWVFTFYNNFFFFFVRSWHPNEQLYEITCRQGTCEAVNPRQIELSWFLTSSTTITWLEYSLGLSQSTLGWVRAMFLGWSNVFISVGSLLLSQAFKCTV